MIYSIALRRRINGSYTANCSLDLSTNNQNVCPKIQCEKEKRNQMKDLNQRFNDNLKLIDSRKDTPVSTKSQKKPSKRIEETQLNAIKPKYGFLKSLDGKYYVLIIINNISISNRNILCI